MKQIAMTSDESGGVQPSNPFTRLVDFILPENAISMKSAVFLVVGLHLLTLAGIWGYSFMPRSISKNTIKEDRRFILESAPIVGVETPIPATFAAAKSRHHKRPWNPFPDSEPPREVGRPPVNAASPKARLASEYIVKKGDTFTAIVKRYGVDPSRLKSLNGIKDENKLLVGQRLKLL